MKVEDNQEVFLLIQTSKGRITLAEGSDNILDVTK